MFYCTILKLVTNVRAPTTSSKETLPPDNSRKDSRDFDQYREKSGCGMRIEFLLIYATMDHFPAGQHPQECSSGEKKAAGGPHQTSGGETVSS